MIYITGDLHADFAKALKLLTVVEEGDVAIVTGDFGFLWSTSDIGMPFYRKNYIKEEVAVLDYISKELKGELVFIDGNHENFDELYQHPIVEWNRGKVHKIRENIFHLMRGEVYEIQGKKILAFGGARSHDADFILDPFAHNFKEERDLLSKQQVLYRINHISWWKEEIPDQIQIDNLKSNVKKNNFKVDFIITHSIPSGAEDILFPKEVMNSYLEREQYSKKVKDFYRALDWIENNVECAEKWYSGHYHIDKQVSTKIVSIYENIYRLI